jgi:hypothetical protein
MASAPKEHAPMLDIHPAHHAANSWKEFFVHIATIVLGLLIAAGLEQTIEYAHHRHLASEARPSIQGSSSRTPPGFNRMEIDSSSISSHWKRTWNCSIPAPPMRRRSTPCNTPGI